MAEEWHNAGRVRPVPVGEWDASRAYTVLDSVSYKDTFSCYTAKKDVPAGTPITNEEYWGIMLDGTPQKNKIDDISKIVSAIEIVNNSDLSKAIETHYALRRTGKVYQTKIYKFGSNPSSAGVKLRDNAGLQYTPSTDTTEGVDDYANIEMFKWINVNYERDADGTPYPTAIEGSPEYRTTGAVDVGVMQMSFYVKWDTSNAEYDLITISDLPHPELGLEPWYECVKADGTVLPWCIGSKYISGQASDGLLRSQPDLNPQLYQSHNNMITNYQKKGEGYWGAGTERNLFLMIFQLIKGATKNSQSLYAGCTNYNYQYPASIERDTADTYFPVTKAQAANLVVGSNVCIGYGRVSNDALNIDRSAVSMRKYADLARILRIEAIDDANSAVYLDVSTGFTTTPVAVNDTLSSPVYLSTMPWRSGTTNKVLGHHDGSYMSNTNGKMPFRIQGREYAIGAYTVASNAAMDINGTTFEKTVYVAPRSVAHSSADATIRNTYTVTGVIPAANSNNDDWWIGDIDVNLSLGAWHPSVKGSSSAQGWADRMYAGGASASGMREYLQGGPLWHASAAGSAVLRCGHSLSLAWWLFCAGD